MASKFPIQWLYFLRNARQKTPHASRTHVHVGSSKVMEKKLECVRMILTANYRIMGYKWKKVKKWCI